jgi:uncharacterized protein (TIGR03435 family)
MKTFLLLFLATATSLAQNSLPALNQKAPELELHQGLQTPGNLIPTLASLHGRLVVLEFWATWCSGCVAAIPHLNETADQLKDQPITFLSVTDEDAGVVKAFLEKRTMKSWIGVDKDGATFARYGILGRPQTLIIDGDGILRAAVEPEQVNVALLDNAIAGRYPEAEHSTRDAAAVPMEFAKGVPPPLLQVLIRPASPPAISGNSPGAYVAAPGGRYELYGVSLETLLYYAEDEKLRQDRLVAPSWFGMDRYDVSTVVPAGRSDLRTRLLLQAAIDTFSLKMHREQRPTEVYVLSAAGTSKLKASSAKRSGGFKAHPGEFTGVATSLERLSSVISHELNDAEVIDETGLVGNYDFDLSWKKDDVSSLTVALRDQLGIRLKKQTRDREFLIVDEASQPHTW